MTDDPLGFKALGESIKAAAPVIIKLLDTAERGVGALARPLLLIVNAKAQVTSDRILARGAMELDAIRALAAARPPPVEIRLVPNAPPTAATIDVDIDDAEFETVPALPARTDDRLHYQERKRQLNIEHVVRDAAEELKDETEFSEEPVDDDWTARFFNDVQDVSSERMRKLWAKVLAGEVKKPGAFSWRTLQVLRNLGGNEAVLFQRAAANATSGGFVIETPHVQAAFSFEDRALLVEAGLATIQAFTELRLGRINAGDAEAWLLFRGFAIRVPNVPAQDGIGFRTAFQLTRVGRELAGLFVVPTELRQLADVARLHRSHGSTVHIMNADGTAQEAALDIDGNPASVA